MNDDSPDDQADEVEQADDAEHIAVIGMAARFPGAEDVDQFWRNLTEGLDTVTRSAARPVPGGGAERSYVPARGLLKDPEWFDAGYFGYSPREARIVDPQHRVLLECADQALEHAGYDPTRYSGAIGVYGGGTDTSYAHLARSGPDRGAGASDMEILLGNATDYLVTRIAYKLGLRGPAVTVQAACATSLVAVHTAVQALLSGDCDMALAGGVAVHVPARNSPYVEGGILSADGVCRTFDAAAGGTVGGDGGGLVVLKRLAEAVSDGDRIHAVLRGTAVNNDGSDRIGFTAPSVEGQAAVIRDAQAVARVDPATVTYVEAHGTATPLGDPIEVAALTKAFRDGTDLSGYCRIGSVKTNIGHTDAAAGAAGLIKTVLALEHGVIPPSLHFSEPNPRIDFAATPFRVADRAQEWLTRGTPRRAGVNSFGIGGTNAHVVLEEAPAPPPTAPPAPWQLLVLSARTATALDAAAENLAAHLDARPELSIADVAWTLQTGRREHDHRRYAVVGGARDAVRTLSGTAGRPAGTGGPPRPRSVTFVFPGTGAAREATRLYAEQRAFRRAFDACHAAVRAFDGVGGADGFGAQGFRPGSTSDDPATADLVAFAEEYALSRTLAAWGVRPASVLGTGVGVLTAAAVAGVFSLDDATRLVAARARLSAPSGGDTPDGTDAAARFEELVREAGPRAPSVPVVCGTSARVLSPDDAVDPGFWSAHLRGESRPHTAFDPLLKDASAVLVELGAGRTLTSAARRHPGHTADHLLVTALPGEEPTGEEPTGEERGTVSEGPPPLLAALGELWLAGVTISWSEVHGARRLRVPLPTYPFERQRHVVEAVGREAVEREAPERETTAVSAATEDDAQPGPEQQDTVGRVARLFAEILGLPDVDAEDSFFSLGGDSLIAVQFLSRAREIFGVEVDVLGLYEAETVTEFAALVDRSAGGHDSPRPALS
ncbi:beta-ketoacyl synthase N-terminal-like domain-containing protein [Streptomyces sp. NPDC047070]|uniref:type I polyketide synthase n=1 Tax=Streptomyces sp. NPDC047070 TaxID=3154923 RepID=UPI003455CD75